MRPDELLVVLEDLSVVVTVDGAGNIAATGPRRHVAYLWAALRRHRAWLTAWIRVSERQVAAERAGVNRPRHEMVFCENCGQPTVIRAHRGREWDSDKWPRCRMTPRCGGANQHGAPLARHRPLRDDTRYDDLIDHINTTLAEGTVAANREPNQ